MGNSLPQNTKVIIGLSGGVDSSVAAFLLKEQGYQVEGLFMKNWEEDDTNTYCSAKEDLKDARAVGKLLDIPVHTINFATEYWQRVFSEFLDEYKAGRTPNPDILCNKEIKFKEFLNHAIKLGADYIATGHYVKKVTLNGNHQLHKAGDFNKDQSYFLYTLNQHQLAKSLFPLADIPKTEVRKIATRLGFINSEKKDSTGICFIGERKFKPFLEDFITSKPGKMLTPEGKPIGQHDGLMFYTLGQRQGLNIGGVKGANDLPWYVVGKDIHRNILAVAQGSEHPWHYSTELTANKIHWINGTPPSNNFQASAKVRYRQKDQICMVKVLENGSITVTFLEPQRAVTPGQSIVLYDGQNTLGGGIIIQTNSPGGLNANFTGVKLNVTTA